MHDGFFKVHEVKLEKIFVVKPIKKAIAFAECFFETLRYMLLIMLAAKYRYVTSGQHNDIFK